MKWVRSIMDVYWDLRPFHETQELYMSHGLSTFEYWYYESKYLTKSTWIKDSEFCSLNGIEYLLNKYPSEKITLDENDRMTLCLQFINDLGMNPITFNMKLCDLK